MPRLLLINGLPGSGKSTLARRYAQEHPLSLCLDIDVIRGLLGAWKEQPSDAGLLARRLATAMARRVLGEGHDVVVPQFLAQPGFIEELQVLADGLGVEFIEVVLLEEPVRAARRLAERAAGPLTTTQRDAHELLDRDGGLDAVVPELHRRLQQMIDHRPATVVVTPVLNDVDQTYRKLIDRI